MRNIDDKTFSAILERIEALKNELSLLEDQVKAISESDSALRQSSGTALEEIDIPVGEPVEPAAEPVEVGVPVAEPVEPAAEPVEVNIPVSEPVELAAEPVPEPVEEPIDIAPEDDTPIDISITEEEDLPKEIEPRKSILDVAKADTAVMDVMAEKQAWRTDRPGMPVKNIISAISLNDRVLLINVLFGEDPLLFQETIARFNSMRSLSEALEFISENHPEWDMNSEPVYRLMMAVRRKLS